MIKKLYIKLINSKFWFNIYYKHTNKHKKDLKDITDRINIIKKNINNKYL